MNFHFGGLDVASAIYFSLIDGTSGPITTRNTPYDSDGHGGVALMLPTSCEWWGNVGIGMEHMGNWETFMNVCGWVKDLPNEYVVQYV